MTEIVKQDAYELISQEDVDFLVKFDEYKKRAKVIEDTIKAKANEYLDANNVEEMTQGVIHIYRTKPYTKKQVDTKALKEQGLYDEFTKDVEVSGSIRIEIVYDED